MRVLVLAIIGGILICCQPASRDLETEDLKEVQVTHAQGFEINWQQGIKIITVHQPWTGAHKSLKYALVAKGQKVPPDLIFDEIIRTPVTKLVLTSTTHLPALDLLAAQNLLIGFPQTQYITTPSIRKAVAKGSVTELGSANGLNMELLLESDPELVITYQSGADYTQLDALSATGIPTVLNADFLEPTPLGRAEWIKFIGHIIDRGEDADSIFATIAARYQQTTKLTQSLASRPAVFSGSMYGGTWYAPGGNSFVSQLIKDAGGQYTWSDRAVAGNLELSFEAMLAHDQGTEYWIGVGGFSSMEALLAADERYKHFSAFETGNIFGYHKRVSAQGGYEYLEMGVARPDLVLLDLVKILHPDLVPDYESYFFQRLP